MKIAMANLLAMVYQCFYLCTREPYAIVGNSLFAHMICDDGLSPIRPEAIIWTNASLLSIEPIEMNSIEIWNKYDNFQTRKLIKKYLTCIFSAQSLCLNLTSPGLTRCHPYAWYPMILSHHRSSLSINVRMQSMKFRWLSVRFNQLYENTSLNVQRNPEKSPGSWRAKHQLVPTRTWWTT